MLVNGAKVVFNVTSECVCEPPSRALKGEVLPMSILRQVRNIGANSPSMGSPEIISTFTEELQPQGIKLASPFFP